jgi:hypothetical protein
MTMLLICYLFDQHCGAMLFYAAMTTSGTAGMDITNASYEYVEIDCSAVSVIAGHPGQCQPCRLVSVAEQAQW